METNLSPKKKEIKVTDTENELVRLRETSKDKNQIKACLFNLIIYASDSRRAKYIEDLVHTIIEKFPCRIIFIKGDANKEDHYLNIDISTVTTKQSGTEVVCDQITITVSKSEVSRVPILILPYLVPDLPIYLLWGQNPVEELEILPKIQKYASRLIFDSECSENLQHFSKHLLEKFDSFKIEIMDINWALTSNWREILAQIFDTPDKIHQLESSKTINITYNDHKTEFLKHSEIRAIYLQGWLATQLGWTFSKIANQDGKRILTYKSKDKQEVVITLSPEIQTTLPPGAILEIEIATKDDHFCAISRKQNTSQVTVHASTLEECALPFTLPLPNIHRGFTFMKEIFYHSTSDHYRHMLKTISQIECSEQTKDK